ncbi:T9SS type A sorting domain-containing protein [Winogradskyella eximia]|uniref:T9SS type A sorting domain-containing protein n=1 Tax=Winogradskyella eximia TaxID=262006 RepID=UPI00249120E6|nr:T9SS type A sorting domain-containing protein [Winogradskyella eximia]
MTKKLLYLFLFLTISITSFAQVANQPNDYVVCDDDNDGFALFDLTYVDAQVLGSQQSAADYTVTYHETLYDAENNFSSIVFYPYVNNTDWLQIIYVRLEDNNTGSYDITTVNLIVNPSPLPVQPSSLNLCDDVGEIPGDEIAVFDLTIKDVEITGSNANWSVAYYETNADAQSQTNVIANPTAYTNRSVNGLPLNPQTLFVTVTDVTTGCLGFTTLTIRVLPNPTPSNTIPDLVLCDEINTGDEVEVFDLTENELLIFNGEPGQSITYYLSENDALAGSNSISDPTQFSNTISPQTIYARVTNNTTGCFAVVDFDIIVNPLPEVDLGMSEQNYCGFDDVILEANSSFADEFIWYRNGFLLPGETSSTLVVTQSDNYQVQVVNTLCGSEAFSEMVSVNLYELSDTIDPQTIIACDNSSTDGTADFNLDDLSASLGLGEGFVISYYTSNIDANQGINSIASPYNSAGETLIIRVADIDAEANGFLGCRYLSTVDLVVNCDIGTITLNAFYDENEDAILDANEINFTNGYFTYEMNNDGIINTIESSTGNFTITSLDEANTYDMNYYFYGQYGDCYSLSVPSFEDVGVLFGEDITIDFPIVNYQSCEDISVFLMNQQSPRPGFYHTNYLVIQNLGLIPVSGTVDYTLDDNLSINSISTSSNYTTTLNANGFSLNFVDLAPQHHIYISIFLQTSASTALGETVTNTAIYTTSTNDIVSDNNESSISEVVIGSYDPNDKMESHGPQILYDDFVTSDEYLYYTIRFQNVGTAEAVFVRIEDELDAQLDESTFQMLRSSHDYVVTRTGNSLEWYFEDINLPAEQDDAEGSNGFVYFKIKPNAGYAIGDIIENTASIYFDFNTPIITNTFQTEFAETLSVENFEAVNFTIYPNPAKDEVTIQLANSNFETGKVNLYNIQGKVILKDIYIQEHASSIDISSLETGLYFVEMTVGNTSTVQKLIVN